MPELVRYAPKATIQAMRANGSDVPILLQKSAIVIVRRLPRFVETARDQPPLGGRPHRPG
jgi:hypothetical protein